MNEQVEQCPDCRNAARRAYSDATTPGFFSDKCAKHRRAENTAEHKEPPEWIRKARTEFIITGGRHTRYNKADESALDEIISKHAPGLSEDVKKLHQRLYALEMANWKNVCDSDVFQNLKHGKFRDILDLLSAGQISTGKAAEAIVERANGVEPTLPAHQPQADELSWKERYDLLKADAQRLFDAADSINVALDHGEPIVMHPVYRCRRELREALVLFKEKQCLIQR